VDQELAIAAVGHAIQLSVAPVFLLSGIGAMLAVMTNRLSRIVDRGRVVETSLTGKAPTEAEAILAHLALLKRRAKTINYSITLCTITALIVSAVVATLFVAAYFGFDASLPIAVLFVAAMTTLFVGLLFFLREIFIATRNLRIGGR
jgi:hypothetical protein